MIASFHLTSNPGAILWGSLDLNLSPTAIIRIIPDNGSTQIQVYENHYPQCQFSSENVYDAVSWQPILRSKQLKKAIWSFVYINIHSKA